MVEKSRVCPRCNGCGKISGLTRNRAPKSDNPNFKGCPKCLEIKTLNDFYSNCGWCRKCVCAKKRIVTREQAERYREKKKKYPLKCINCNLDFLGHSLTQKVCSQRCNCLYMNNKKRRSGYVSLSNELREQFDNYE